jgi:hypothetical protein
VNMSPRPLGLQIPHKSGSSIERILTSCCTIQRKPKNQVPTCKRSSCYGVPSRHSQSNSQSGQQELCHHFLSFSSIPLALMRIMVLCHSDVETHFRVPKKSLKGYHSRNPIDGKAGQPHMRAARAVAPFYEIQNRRMPDCEARFLQSYSLLDNRRNELHRKCPRQK